MIWLLIARPGVVATAPCMVKVEGEWDVRLKAPHSGTGQPEGVFRDLTVGEAGCAYQLVR